MIGDALASAFDSATSLVGQLPGVGLITAADPISILASFQDATWTYQPHNLIEPEALKLMGLKITPSRPVKVPGGQLTTAALALVMVAAAIFLWIGNYSVPAMFLILAAALIFGVTMTLPIGGADMPVVISLLNSFTGTAVAMAGFVLDNPVLIIAGALVGA